MLAPESHTLHHLRPSLRLLLLAAVFYQLIAGLEAAVARRPETGAKALTGGCLASGLCCQGKNNTCRTDGPRLSNKDSFTCFCDSACGELGDCCLDYKRACQPVDCEVGEWQEWSECDVRCGPGVKQRTRPVRVPAINGGRQCPPTVEKVACDGTRCKFARASGGHEELRETGKILPALFGPWRYDKVYNPFMDIRKNLFEHYEKSENPSERPSYCAEYEIIDARPGCQAAAGAAPWTKSLVKGTTVCVECQPLAMRRKLGGRCRGHGVMGRETRWNAATAHGCDGQWVMKTARKDCRCSPDSQLSFIFI